MQPLRPASSPRAADATVLARLAAQVQAGVLDAELGALAWILLGARTPVLVAGGAGSGREALADALADCLPPSAIRLQVAADDEFAWLPEAADLGWRTGPGDRTETPHAGADPGSGVLMVRNLMDAAAGGPAADRARLLVRALSLGYGMLATAPGSGLDDLLERLDQPDVGTVEDERSRLGLVLVMAPADAPGDRRVNAAHYLRPVALDTHGHVQRRAPAVLATWNESTARWDHFAWGVMAELAGRVGMAPRDLEREQARRAELLAR